MKNISRKNRKPNGNVLSIADNPKFQTKMKFIHKPKNVESENLRVYQIDADYLGFRRGDELVCKEDFKPSEITPNTVVIADFDGEHRVVCNAENENILAVVVAFTREVAQ
jgi:hypothetical protein